mmetsp:Transcript_125786/g.268357  ORF Transcript_125786/g.268357 Transcript_125786/m.268357 type:complete len:255 (+) Transcript_125786:27-791(+)
MSAFGPLSTASVDPLTSGLHRRQLRRKTDAHRLRRVRSSFALADLILANRVVDLAGLGVERLGPRLRGLGLLHCRPRQRHRLLGSPSQPCRLQGLGPLGQALRRSLQPLHRLCGALRPSVCLRGVPLGPQKREVVGLGSRDAERCSTRRARRLRFRWHCSGELCRAVRLAPDSDCHGCSGFLRRFLREALQCSAHVLGVSHAAPRLTEPTLRLRAGLSGLGDHGLAAGGLLRGLPGQVRCQLLLACEQGLRARL